jgi:hypothetical protein
MKFSAPHRGWTSGQATPFLRPNPYAAKTATPAGRHLSLAEIRADNRGQLCCAAARPLRAAASASGGSAAIKEDEPLHMVDHVRHADLHPGAGDADGADEKVHFVSSRTANTCSTPVRTWDFSALARRIVSGLVRQLRIWRDSCAAMSFGGVGLMDAPP